MSSFKGHRESRRRFPDDDRSPFGAADPEPAYFQRSARMPAAGGPSVDAEVLWFNASKGFGFVRADDGAEAFLHIRALESAGHSNLMPGAKLKVVLEDGQKGKQVSRVVEVVSGGAAAPEPSAGRRSFAPSGAPPSGPVEEAEGTVKWYSSEKGFGFISVATGGKDVFVHATALERSGLSALQEGQKVIVQVRQGKKGPEAQSLSLG